MFLRHCLIQQLFSLLSQGFPNSLPLSGISDFFVWQELWEYLVIIFENCRAPIVFEHRRDFEAFWEKVRKSLFLRSLIDFCWNNFLNSRSLVEWYFFTPDKFCQVTRLNLNVNTALQCN